MKYWIRVDGVRIVAVMQVLSDTAVPGFEEVEYSGTAEELMAWCAYQNGSLVPIPAKPGEFYRLSDQLVWEFDLAAARGSKWAQIKRARDAAEQAGFVWDGSTFDCDSISQSRIQGGALMATTALLNSAPFSITWTLADNATRTLDAADMIAVGIAMGQHIDSIHQTGRRLRSQLDAATTPAEISAVEWPV